jgi:hypothetical protein
MTKQVFIQNPDSGEPWALCGSVEDEVLAKALGYFVQAEVENAARENEKKFDISIKLVEMTDEEVAALPDI